VRPQRARARVTSLTAMAPAAMPRMRRRVQAVRIIGALLIGSASWDVLRATLREGVAFASGRSIAQPRRCVSRQAGDDGSQGVEMYETIVAEQSEDLAQRFRVEDLKPGQELVGIVNGIAPFGAFVDVGAERDGLVHISKITVGFVDNIRNFVEAGQTVEVRVLEVSPEGKLTLTMLKDIDEEASEGDVSEFESVSESEWLDATVDGIMDFGAFVVVTPPSGGPPVNGLLHLSQIKAGFVEHPSQELEIGQAIRVRILAIDRAKGKLKVTMKDVGEQPLKKGTQDVSAFSAVDEGEWFVGTVNHTRGYGILVDLPMPDGEGIIQGMVHVSEIRDDFVDDPALEVEVGQEVRVRVINVDMQSGRIGLSMKEPRAAPA